MIVSNDIIEHIQKRVLVNFFIILRNDYGRLELREI
jgi:hypothetical protein